MNFYKTEIGIIGVKRSPILHLLITIFLFCKAESDEELTDRPLLIQTPLSKAVYQPDLVVLVTSPPGGLEDLDACRQPYVVFVVVAPGS